MSLHTHHTKSCFITLVAWHSRHNFLIIEMENRRRYGYLGVPYQRASRLARAHSVGQYYNRHIKGRYDSVRLHDKEPTPS